MPLSFATECQDSEFVAMRKGCHNNCVYSDISNTNSQLLKIQFFYALCIQTFKLMSDNIQYLK